MKSETIVYCIIALLLGMLLFHMLSNVCICESVVEGQTNNNDHTIESIKQRINNECSTNLDDNSIYCEDLNIALDEAIGKGETLLGKFNRLHNEEPGNCDERTQNNDWCNGNLANLLKSIVTQLEPQDTRDPH